MSSEVFRNLLVSGIGRFPRVLSMVSDHKDDAVEQLVRYRELVLIENERQNLTRLLSPEEFYWGHIEDVFQLLENTRFEYPVVDLGTGGGVPGVPAAILTQEPWILLDSELRKTEFLRSSTAELSMHKVSVVHERMETALSSIHPKTLVSRAVGKVEKIYGWIGKCSTWNRLILFKGPAFESEWAEFEHSKHRGKLTIESTHEYSAYSPSDQAERSRRIVVLRRV
jgi:16S rRNA (guanine527-N7)-methyltransferase